MNGAYIERRGIGVSLTRLQVLKAVWRDFGADSVIERAGQVVLDHEDVPRDGYIYLHNSLHLSSLLFPPMWFLSAPRITSTLRFRIEDPHDFDVRSDTKGTAHSFHAYTLGLTEKGFHAQYSYELGAQLLGLARDVRDSDGLLQRVNEHLQMGRERRLREWGTKRS